VKWRNDPFLSEADHENHRNCITRFKEITMTHIHPNFDTHFFILLVRWLQARYTDKLEHYAATHEAAC